MARTTARGNERAARPSAPALQLHDDWIRDLFNKRGAQASAVAVVHTQDTIRHNQLLAYLLSQWNNHHIYAFEPWQGLQRWDTGRGHWSPVLAETNAYAPQEFSGTPTLSELAAALRHIDPLLKQHPSVLLLKDVEPSSSFKSEPLLHALRAWSLHPQMLSKGSMVVLLSPNADAVLDEVTKQRVIQVAPPLAEPGERASVAGQVAHTLGLSQAPEMAELVNATAGLSLHDTRALLIEAHHRAPQQGLSLGAVRTLKRDRMKNIATLDVEEPRWGFEAVGGYSAVKAFIQRHIVEKLRKVQRAKAYGTQLPKGLLLFGPPGTGKTLLARALAREINMPFLSLKVEALFDKHLGETGQRLGQTLRLIDQMSPLVLFVDEIDQLGQRTQGSDGASQETRRAFGQLLKWMGERREERHCLIVGATNTLEHMDTAMVRAGRFDFKIPFLWPNRAGREEILAIHLGVHRHAATPPPPMAFPPERLCEIIAEIAQKTALYSGAELEQLAQRARDNAFAAFDRNAMVEQDLLQADYRIPLHERRRQLARYLAQAREQTDHPEFLDACESELHELVA